MPYHYNDPTRAEDPYALPDIEVFEVWTDAHGTRHNAWDWADTEGFDGDGPEPCVDGWYAQSCMPGYLPNSDSPEGPHDTEREALEAFWESGGLWEDDVEAARESYLAEHFPTEENTP